MSLLLNAQLLRRLILASIAVAGTMIAPLAHAQTTIAQQVADPAYFYPSGTPNYWTQLSQTTPTVGITIANVSNGPNNVVDSNYTAALQQAHQAGIKVLGYVDTGYFGGSSPARTTRLGQTDVNSWTTQIEQDVNTWYSLYGSSLDGIFFDDGQNVCGTNNQYVTLYTDILNYVKRNHLGAYVVTNPGVAVPQCLQNVADTLLTFESSYDCYTNDASCPSGQGYTALGWNPVDPQKIFHAVYSVPSTSLTNASTLSKQRNAGYFFFTDASLADNPYGSLPSYFSTEAADGASGGTADTTPPTPPDTLDTVNVGATWAILNWGPSTDHHGSGVVGYDLYQGGVKITSVPASSNPQVTITGLLPLTYYTFTATARDAAGNVSSTSNALAFETDVNDGAVVAPTSVQASQVNYTDIVLSWNAAQTDEYSIAYYDVFLNGTKVLTVDANVLSADVIGLAPSTAYSLTVQARDTHGDASAMSSTVNATTPAYPAGGAIQNVNVQLTATTVTISATYLAPFGFHHVYIDADNSASTGYLFSWESPNIGADYLIENSTLLVHAGTSGSFSWSSIATVNPVITGSASSGLTYTWTIPVSTFSGTPLATTEQYLVEGTGYSPEAYATVYTARQH